MGFNIHFLLVKDDDWEQYSPDEQLVYNSFLDNKFNNKNYLKWTFKEVKDMFDELVELTTNIELNKIPDNFSIKIISKLLKKFLTNNYTYVKIKIV